MTSEEVLATKMRLWQMEINDELKKRKIQFILDQASWLISCHCIWDSARGQTSTYRPQC